MATVTPITETKTTTTGVTVSLTAAEALLLADMLDEDCEPLKQARLANKWIYTLIADLIDA